MKQEETELLLKYLCMALYYKVKCKIHYTFNNETTFGEDVDAEKDDTLTKIDVELKTACFDWYGDCLDIDEIKPYLRLLSNMTEEEKAELFQLMGNGTDIQRIDFYLSHHFDFMGLIQKGLAIEVTEGNNPYKE